ncbi:MAG: type II toxin-antitoxin system prevent-host-death family antitoxin [Phycisphaerales bacterium]
MQWKLAEAKNRLSELINRVLTEGPQVIRRRDDAFVVLTEARYRELTGERATFKAMLVEGPDFDGLDLTRDRSAMRGFEAGHDADAGAMERRSGNGSHGAGEAA